MWSGSKYWVKMNTRIVSFLYLLFLTAKVYGQGQININNRGFALVNDASGAPLTGTNYVAQVWYGGSASTLTNSFRPSPFRASSTTALSGTWNPAATGGPGSVATLDGFGPGSTVTLQVSVWDASRYSTWNQAQDQPGTGVSDPFTFKLSTNRLADGSDGLKNLVSFRISEGLPTINLTLAATPQTINWTSPANDGVLV